jgi:ferrous iron transport protein A
MTMTEIELLSPPVSSSVTTSPLSHIPEGQRVRVVHIEGGRMIRRRLAELGLLPGSEVRVIRSYRSGPIVVVVRQDTRLVLGRGVAARIMVQAAGEQDVRYL